MERHRIDIQERTFGFAVRGVRLVSRLPHTLAGGEIGKQALRSAISVGANVEEADAAESKRDFVHKMGIAHKEARETRYWLRIIRTTLLDDEEVRELMREWDELVRILYAIVQKAQQGMNNEL